MEWIKIITYKDLPKIDGTYIFRNMFGDEKEIRYKNLGKQFADTMVLRFTHWRKKV